MSGEKRFLVGITGASGAVYAKALLEHLARSGAGRVTVVVSAAGRRVLHEELGAGPEADDPRFEKWLDLAPEASSLLEWARVEDIGAAAASGSNRLDAMAVAPCSMRTLAAVAAGLADNLITRAADVCLKESRRLVIVPRESPFSAIHLENMLRLARLGVRIVPPSPPFYHHPKQVEDLVAAVVQKIVEQMGLEYEGGFRWGG